MYVEDHRSSATPEGPRQGLGSTPLRAPWSRGLTRHGDPAKSNSNCDLTTNDRGADRLRSPTGSARSLARNGMPAFVQTPVLPETSPVNSSARPVCAVALQRPVLWTRAMRWSGRAWRSTMPIEINSNSNPLRAPWNKGRLVGQKRPLRPKEVWAIRVRLQIKHNKRDLAMFNLGIDSKLRGCDLVSPRVDDIAVRGHVRDRATIIQHKTGRPVQFEITEQTRASLQDWLNARPADRGPYVFPSRVHNQPHVTARQYARIVHGWIEGAGMDSSAYGTHSMRRTKAAQIYRKTGNLRAVQLLLEMATKCPRTAGRGPHPLPVPSALRRSGADQTTARSRGRRVRRPAPTRRHIRLPAGLDDGSGGILLHDWRRAALST